MIYQPDETYPRPPPIRYLKSGGIMVYDYLLTPEDAVRMLIRTMGRDPADPTFDNVPKRVVGLLQAFRDDVPDCEAERMALLLLADRLRAAEEHSYGG